jgi:hypothetical protein
MDNQPSLSPDSSDSVKTNPVLNPNSVDGFARPTNPPLQSSGFEPPSDSSTTPSIAPHETSHLPEQPVSSAPGDHTKPALSTPSVISNSSQKKSKMWTTILVVLILIVFAGGIYGVYAYQQKKINNLNTQVNSLTASNVSLNSQLSKAKSSVSVSLSNSSSNTTLTLFKIPELGISFNLPANLADLTYVANSAKTSVNVSTQTLTTLDTACTASATSAPLGSITKTNGKFPTTTSTTTTLIKQYTTYYIAYVKPAASCSTVAQVNSLASSLVTDLKSSFSTIQVVSS